MKDQITAEQAIDLLPEGDEIHTFSNPAGILLGADMSREGLIDALRKAEWIALAGPQARAMGHGIAFYDGEYTLFVATDGAKIGAFDPGEIRNQSN